MEIYNGDNSTSITLSPKHILTPTPTTPAPSVAPSDLRKLPHIRRFSTSSFLVGEMESTQWSRDATTSLPSANVNANSSIGTVMMHPFIIRLLMGTKLRRIVHLFSIIMKRAARMFLLVCYVNVTRLAHNNSRICTQPEDPRLSYLQGVTHTSSMRRALLHTKSHHLINMEIRV